MKQGENRTTRQKSFYVFVPLFIVLTLMFVLNVFAIFCFLSFTISPGYLCTLTSVGCSKSHLGKIEFELFVRDGSLPPRSIPFQKCTSLLF